MSKFSLSTPIYYVNDRPHIGTAYTTLIADSIARYRRMKGDEVFFLTGTDENSQKNLEAAEKRGFTDLKKYLDEMAATWQTAWDTLGLTHDDFIRTTESRHRAGIKKFFDAVNKKGDIYKGNYEGFYCDGCEAFITESDLVDGKCPVHNKAPRLIAEENYFFRLTNYRDALLEYIEKNPEFIQPLSRRNEIVSYIKDFMKDVSISRQKKTAHCGIEFPLDADQVIYVWFDALINYLSAIGYGSDEKLFKKWWPMDLHIVGKDILKFHAALWPAMLMSAGLPLPKTVFAHGFFTVNGEKMSKSLGNVVDPVELVTLYPLDAVRYFLLSEIKFGEDGDFSLTRLKERYESEIANALGNLVHRALSMTEQYAGGLVPQGSAAAEGLDPLCEIDIWRTYSDHMEAYRFQEAVGSVWGVIRSANQFIEQEKPWALFKENKQQLLNDVLYNILETLRQVAWLLLPLMPDTAERIWQRLGLDPAVEKEQPLDLAQVWGGLKPQTKINKGEPLFPKEK